MPQFTRRNGALFVTMRVGKVGVGLSLAWLPRVR